MRTESLHQRVIDQLTNRYNPLSGLDQRVLNSILERAWNGDFAPFQWLMHRVERRDSVVKSVTRRLLSKVEALPWSIQTRNPEDPGIDKRLLERQQTFLKERYEALSNLKGAFRHLARGENRGYSHLEKLYGPDGYPRALQVVEHWYWWRDGFQGQWYYNPKAGSNPAKSAMTRIDEEIRKNLIIYEVEDPAGEIYAQKFLDKSFANKDWTGFIEGYGIPWMFFVLPQCANETIAAQMQAIAEQVAADGRGVLPFGSDVKEASAGNRSVNPFGDYLRSRDESIVLTGTGGLLTVLTAPGSGTLAGSAHEEAWNEVVGGVGKHISETMQEDFDLPLLRGEFGPDAPILAWFELTLPKSDEKRGDIVTDIQTLNASGYRVTPGFVTARTGFELEEAEPLADTNLATVNRRREQAAALLNAKRERRTLLENALADALDITPEWLAPLGRDLDRLIALAESETATVGDLQTLVNAIVKSAPEALDGMAIDELAHVIETALGAATVAGLDQSTKRRNTKK